jgi:protein-disulfide isomerase
MSLRCLLRNLGVVILLLLSLGCLVSPGATPCKPLSDADKAVIALYLHRQFDLTPTRVVMVTAVEPVGDSCYKRIEITGLDRPTSLFLSPDNRYLSSAVADVTTDPRLARMQERKNRSDRLLVIASAPSPRFTGTDHTLIEFIDYQCSFCRQMGSWLTDMPEQLRSQIGLRFINLPLPIHPWARSAALYAVCLRDDPKTLMTFQETLFSNGSSEFSDSELQTVVKRLTGDRFADLTSCYASDSTKAYLEKQIAIAKEVSATGTPALFLDGKPLFVSSKEDLINQISNAAQLATKQ